MLQAACRTFSKLWVYIKISVAKWCSPALHAENLGMISSLKGAIDAPPKMECKFWYFAQQRESKVWFQTLRKHFLGPELFGHCALRHLCQVGPSTLSRSDRHCLGHDGSLPDDGPVGHDAEQPLRGGAFCLSTHREVWLHLWSLSNFMFALACAQQCATSIVLFRLRQQHWCIFVDHLGQWPCPARLHLGLYCLAAFHQRGTKCAADPAWHQWIGDARVEWFGRPWHLAGFGAVDLGWQISTWSRWNQEFQSPWNTHQGDGLTMIDGYNMTWNMDELWDPSSSGVCGKAATSGAGRTWRGWRCDADEPGESFKWVLFSLLRFQNFNHNRRSTSQKWPTWWRKLSKKTAHPES